MTVGSSRPPRPHQFFFLLHFFGQLCPNGLYPIMLCISLASVSSRIRGGSRVNPFQECVHLTWPLWFFVLIKNMAKLKKSKTKPIHAFRVYVYNWHNVNMNKLGYVVSTTAYLDRTCWIGRKTAQIINYLWNLTPEILRFFDFPSAKIKHLHIKTVMNDWFGVLWSYMLNKLKNVHIYIFVPVYIKIST